MYAATNVHISTEFYGSCLITSQPKSVSNMWVPYAFVAWREHGMVQFLRFPVLILWLVQVKQTFIAGYFDRPELGRQALKRPAVKFLHQ